MPFITTSQVRVVSQAEQQARPKLEVTPIAYDSISNMPQDLHGFVGQELFLMPRIKQLRAFGYSCFTNEFGASVGTVDHEQVAGHTFKVVDVIDCKGFSKGKTILKLCDENDNSIYYADVKEGKKDCPFLTLGYKAKYESTNKGHGFYLSTTPANDFVTGAEIKADENTVWTFNEIIVYEDTGNIGYLFTNPQGETVVISHYSIESSITSFDEVKRQKEEYNAKIKKLKKKYGAKMVEAALDNTIMVGMPEELVILAWGEPTRINQASYGDQWVYGSFDARYVYFENGKVTGWN